MSRDETSLVRKFFRGLELRIHPLSHRFETVGTKVLLQMTSRNL